MDEGLAVVEGGARALAAVRALTGAGRVEAVFRRAAHLALPGGSLAALCVPGVLQGPLNLSSSLPPDADLGALLAPGDPVSRLGAALLVGPLTLGLSGARAWRSPPPPRAVRWEGLGSRSRACALAAAEGQVGLGQLAAEAAGLGPAPDTPLLLAARAAWARLETGALSRDRQAVREAARGLVGLGPGLTPSGDDLLAGLVGALRMGGEGWAGRAVAGAAGERATPSFSRALLLCACRGELGEGTDALARAVVSGTEGRVLDAARALRACGATSGSDLAAGAALGGMLLTGLGGSRRDR